MPARLQQLGPIGWILVAVVVLVVGTLEVRQRLARRQPPPATPAEVGQVVRVVDGDTVKVVGYDKNVRQLGVDAPELKSRDCFSRTATEFVQELLPPGTHVRLVFDVQTFDVYDRPLAYIERASDGLDVGEALLRSGYAIVFNPDWNRNRARLPHYEKVQAEAARHERGLWGAACQP